MTQEIVILWFRQDLRLSDNPALIAAAQSCSPILPLYILDDDNAGEWAMGGASRWWLHQSLNALNESLEGVLCLQKGNALDVLQMMIKQYAVKAVYWNRCYEPWRIKRDTKVKEALKTQGLEVKSFNGSLLFEPHKALKDDGTPYKVFTPFYKKGCLQNNPEPPAPKPVPENLKFYNCDTLPLEALELMPNIDWHTQMEQEWQPGEDGAKKRLSDFLKIGLKGYKEGRNHPSKLNVSRLSPHLHFGEVSPATVWMRQKRRWLLNNAKRTVSIF